MPETDVPQTDDLETDDPETNVPETADTNIPETGGIVVQATDKYGSSRFSNESDVVFI